MPLLAEALRREGFTEDEVEPSTGATHTASLKTICNIKSKNCKKCPEMPCCVRVSRAVYCPARGGFIWSEARVP